MSYCQYHHVVVNRTKLPRLVMSQSTSLIDRLFSTIDLEDIDNKTLRDELPKLQEELQALVDELMGIRSSKRREVSLQYEANQIVPFHLSLSFTFLSFAGNIG